MSEFPAMLNEECLEPITGKAAFVTKDSFHQKLNQHAEVLNRVITEFGLQDYGTNAAEGILCESSETRVTNIFDYVMKGMYMFEIDTDGHRLVKPYGKSTWEKM